MYIDRQIDRIVKGLKKHVSLKLVDFKIYKLSFFVLLPIQNNKIEEQKSLVNGIKIIFLRNFFCYVSAQ